MTLVAWISVIGIVVTFFLAIMAHIIVSVFWAGKVTAKLDILVETSNATKNKLEAFQQSCFTKAEAEIKLVDTEVQHKAIWKKIDSVKHALIKVFQKQGLDLSQEDL